MELLAVECRGDLVLGDEDLLLRLQALSEMVESDTHLGADVGHQIRIEHERIARPAQGVSVRICTGVRFGASVASLSESTVPLAGCAVSCRPWPAWAWRCQLRPQLLRG